MTRSTSAWSALIAGLVAVVAFIVPNLNKSTNASSTRPSRTTAARSTNVASRSTNVESRPTTTPGSVASNSNDPRLRSIGFRSARRLNDHYIKHGREFGTVSKADYLAMAQDLRDAPLSNTVVEATQKDGTLSRFDRASGAFIAFNTDLSIRTFFKPNDGEAYFRRAAKLSH